MKAIICLLFFICFLHNISYCQVSENSTLSFYKENHIMVPSINEVSTLNYLQKILESDTNSIIFIEAPIFFLKGIMAGTNEISGWEEPDCEAINKQLVKIGKTNHIFEIGVPFKSWVFDTFYLKSVDQEFFEDLKKQCNIDFSRSSFSQLSQPIKIDFVQSLKLKLNLTSLDSLLILSSLNGLYPNLDDIIKVSGKSNIYFVQELTAITDYKELRLLENSIYLIAKHGVKGNRLSWFALSNRLKTQDEFSKIQWNALPKKVRLLRKMKVPREYFIHNTCIYLNQLSSCGDNG